MFSRVHSIQNPILWLSLVPLAFGLAFVTIVAWMAYETGAAERTAERSDEILRETRVLQNDLLIAESGVRTYALTGVKGPERASLRSIALVPRDVSRLQALVAGTRSQAALAASVAEQARREGNRLNALMRAMRASSRKEEIEEIYDTMLTRDSRSARGDPLEGNFRETLLRFVNDNLARRTEATRVLARNSSRWGAVLGGFTILGVGLTLLMTLTISRSIIRRLNELARQANDFAKHGTISERLPGSDEISAVSRTLHDMAVQVQERNQVLVRYRILAEHAKDSIFFQRRSDLHILEANQAAVQSYGYSIYELLGMTNYDLREPCEAMAPEKRVPETGAFNLSFETVHRRKDGTTFPVEVYMQNAVIDGGDFVMTVIRDLSERRQSERLVREALNKAVEASRLKSEFVATMSHELRTPMNGVIGMTDLLLDTELTPQQREFAATARDSAHSLLCVINDILDFSKIEAGKMKLEIVEFDVLAQVEDVGGMLRLQALEKGITLMTYVDPAIPSRLLGDPMRLRQVLVNLVGNAVKFTEAGGVAVVVELLPSEGENARISFAVRDTGIGIDPDVIPKLFTSFTQADGSTTRKYGGSGLGLTISKQLVSLMGGKINVESAVGKGSTFSLVLEFRKTEQEPGRPERNALRGVRLLVVDDDAISRDILERYLRSWDVRVSLVGTADEALRLLRKSRLENEAFALALVDWKMPGIDGMEFARIIRSDPALADTKLILVTAFDRDDQGAKAIASGFSAYLTKPVRQAQLYDNLADAISGVTVKEVRREHVLPQATHDQAILLVEDNPVNRQVTLRQLERLGYHADVAENGREACTRIMRRRFDVVLMDCQMPIMDGFEATRAIRQRESRTGGHVPIVAMTANALSGDRDRCVAAGMDDYLSKPVSLDELRVQLERWLSPQPASPQILNPQQIVDIFGEDNQGAVAFLVGVAPRVEALCRKIVEERDEKRLRELAHELKGAAANIGATDLARAAIDLEARIKDGGMRDIDQTVQGVDDACKRFVTAALSYGEAVS
jgi:two-component system sensor histidine kinase/response regulator